MNNSNKKPNKNFNIAKIFFFCLFFIVFFLFIQGSFSSEQTSFNNITKSNLIKKLKVYKKNEEDKLDFNILNVYINNNNQIIKLKIEIKKEFTFEDKNKTKIQSGLYSFEMERSDWEKIKNNLNITPKVYHFGNLPSTWFGIVSNLFFMLSSSFLFIIALFILYKYLLPSMGGGIGGLGSKFKGTEFKKSTVKFSDIAGIEEEKKELIEIIDFLKTPKKYIDMGARIPKGILLYGLPGTGKTLLAKAVSGESNVPFFSVSGSEFEETFVGMGASRIREMFKKAKKFAPCIIFIDEIDSLGSKRQNMGANDQTLNQFLTEMDGFEPNEGIIIIGATNRTETLDSALLRSGRFDRKIQIPLPDLKAREEILKIHIKNKKIDEDIVLKEIAQKTPGFSGAELENILNEAALFSVRRNKKIITKLEIEEGIDRVIGGPAKVSKIINPKTRMLVSIHEAGHALIGLMLSDAQVVQKITIIPRGSAGGFTIITPRDETLINSKRSLYQQIAGFLGGRAAEEIMFGEWGITTGAHDDFKKATRIATQMAEKFGMTEFGLRYKGSDQETYYGNSSKISEVKTIILDKSIDEILETSFDLAKKTIIKEKELLLLIAESLLILETITFNEIKFIFKNRELPKKAKEIKEKNPEKKYLDLSLIKKDIN